MRKGLLLMTTLMAAGSLWAKNEKIDDFYTNGISRDGTYIYGSDGTFFLIRNLKTGEEWNYSIDYNAGDGNCWTEDGMMVGNLDDLTPALWKNGQWTPLEIKNVSVSHILRGVTPDGSIICGTEGQPKPSGDVEDYLMSAPVIYERQADGSYGDPIALPYPELDITGRVPQYVTANNISDDGRTIIGQIVDGNGFFIYPIAFYKEEDGNWTYDIVQPDAFNPNKITFPEYPGSGPIQPMAETFLNEEQKAAYDQAMEEWYDQGSDLSTEPDPFDFLSGDTLQAFLKAESEFNTVQAKWETNFVKWMQSYSRLLNTGYTFEFNDLYLSPDGRYYGTSSKKEAETTGEGGGIDLQMNKVVRNAGNINPHDGNGTDKYTPFVFDLKNETFKKYDTDLINGIELTGITNDGTVIGVNEPTPYPQAYLFLNGDDKMTDLKTYIASISQETANWMNVNMIYDLDVYDPENDNYQLVEDYMITGIPYITPDLKTIVTTAYAVWTTEGAPYFTCVLTPEDPTSVKAVENITELTLTTTADGTIRVNTPADIEVYDLAGVRVSKTENATEVSPEVTKGLYIVKASREGKDVITRKVAL